ncbi:MAG: metallophosphoesterase, partial [Leptospiraceae bacterium]|nr:metallophosphoesterase [Leptospiraceae bacterium]
MQSRHGTFYVTGNHEYYAGALPWIAEVKRLGMEVLLNEHRIVHRQGAQLSIGGVTDFNAGGFYREHKSDPQKAFENSPEGVVRILLAHQPRSIQAAAKAGVHLQLSGHTHGGQFFPGNLFVPLQQPFVKGLHRFQNTQIFVHSGTGYWGPPLRVGTNAEIALIRLQRSDSNSVSKIAHPVEPFP